MCRHNTETAGCQTTDYQRYYCCCDVITGYCDVYTMSHSSSGFHTEGGWGGFIPLMILARGGYPPIKLQNSVFLMGILVKSFKKVFRRQIPFFSKFVQNLTILFIRFLDMNQLLSALNFTIIYCPNNPSIWCQIILGLCIYLNFRPDCYRCSCQFRVVFAEK